MVNKRRETPELVVFSENCIGGVQSYYANLLKHIPAEKFDKKWILVDQPFNDNPKPVEGFHTGYEEVFAVQPFEHIFKIAERLQSKVSDKPGVVLLNFETEMAVMDLYRKKHKALIAICHDAYFLPIIKKYAFLLDAFIAHNPFFYEELKKELPERSKDVYYLPYGIQLPNVLRKPNLNDPLKIILIARLQQKKGVLDIPEIDAALKQNGVHVQWTIAGDGPEKSTLIKLVQDRSNFNFVSPATTKEMHSIAAAHDVFILPSYLDGMPVSLMETMGSGLVPVLSNFNEGIAEIITPDIGFIVPKGDIHGFAKVIQRLSVNRDELEALSKRAYDKALTDFDVHKKVTSYCELFEKYETLNRHKPSGSINYGRRIDHPSFPKTIRMMIKIAGALLRKAKSLRPGIAI